MSQFRITRELLSGYCQAGLTVKEMADAISAASGYPCSQGTVRSACTTYGINLRRKPLKSPFTFGDNVVTNATSNTEVNAEENTSANGVVGF